MQDWKSGVKLTAHFCELFRVWVLLSFFEFGTSVHVSRTLNDLENDGEPVTLSGKIVYSIGCQPLIFKGNHYGVSVGLVVISFAAKLSERLEIVC